MVQQDRITYAGDKEETPCLSLDELLGYAENKLPEDERIKVEAHLKQCEFCRKAQNGFAAYPNKQEIRAAFKAIDDKIRLRLFIHQIQQHNRLVPYAIAAALLIGLTSIIYRQHFKEKPNEKLFIEHFEHHASGFSSPRDVQPQDKLKEAFAKYEAKDYKGALRLFQELLTTEPEKALIHFYMGISYLATDDPQQAIANFQMTLEVYRSGQFKEPAEWYLALAYLKVNDLEQCKIALTRIISNHGVYEERAAKLFERLISLK